MVAVESQRHAGEKHAERERERERESRSHCGESNNRFTAGWICSDFGEIVGTVQLCMGLRGLGFCMGFAPLRFPGGSCMFLIMGWAATSICKLQTCSVARASSYHIVTGVFRGNKQKKY
jgi:hypothetical protein